MSYLCAENERLIKHNDSLKVRNDVCFIFNSLLGAMLKKTVFQWGNN